MSVAKSSLLMAGGTITSRILGFARTVVLALTIGVTTDAADAFGVANQLPNNVYAIIAGGVLSAVLVPQIVKARSHTDGGLGYIDRLLTLAIKMPKTIGRKTLFMKGPCGCKCLFNGWCRCALTARHSRILKL